MYIILPLFLRDQKDIGVFAAANNRVNYYYIWAFPHRIAYQFNAPHWTRTQKKTTRNQHMCRIAGLTFSIRIF
jgi:hypothetical protein